MVHEAYQCSEGKPYIFPRKNLLDIISNNLRGFSNEYMSVSVTTILSISTMQKDKFKVDLVAQNLLLYILHIIDKQQLSIPTHLLTQSLDLLFLFISLCNSSQLFHMFISSL